SGNTPLVFSSDPRRPVDPADARRRFASRRWSRMPATPRTWPMPVRVGTSAPPALEPVDTRGECRYLPSELCVLVGLCAQLTELEANLRKLAGDEVAQQRQLVLQPFDLGFEPVDTRGECVEPRVDTREPVAHVVAHLFAPLQDLGPLELEIPGHPAVEGRDGLTRVRIHDFQDTTGNGAPP